MFSFAPTYYLCKPSSSIFQIMNPAFPKEEAIKISDLDYSKDSLVQDSYGELNNRKESDTTEVTLQPQQTIEGSHMSGALKFRKARCWMSPVLSGWQCPCFCCPILDISGIVSRHLKGGWTLILTLDFDSMCLSYFLEILNSL